MAIALYLAVIERTDDGFAVFFPDLACGGAGDSIEAAVADAEHGLAAHLDFAHESGVEVPPPTPIDRVEVEGGINEVARILVRYEAPAQSVRLNITMDQSLLKRVDAAAEREGYTRSGFLAAAARRSLAETGPGYDAGAKKTQAVRARKVGRAAQTGMFPTTAALAANSARKRATSKKKMK